MIFSGRVWKFGDNISTDVIMPGDVVFASDLSEKEAASHSMRALRPGWAKLVQKGDIIVAGKNFGCGSGRPAPRMLKTLGISVVVADSISRQFFRNSIHLGFVAVSCPGISEAFEEGEIAEVQVETGIVNNLSRHKSLHGEALPPDSPPYQILIAGGIDALITELTGQAGN